MLDTANGINPTFLTVMGWAALLVRTLVVGNVKPMVDRRTDVAGTTSDVVTVRVFPPRLASTVTGYVPGTVPTAELTVNVNAPLESGTEAADRLPLKPFTSPVPSKVRLAVPLKPPKGTRLRSKVVFPAGEMVCEGLLTNSQ